MEHHKHIPFHHRPLPWLCALFAFPLLALHLPLPLSTLPGSGTFDSVVSYTHTTDRRLFTAAHTFSQQMQGERSHVSDTQVRNLGLLTRQTHSVLVEHARFLDALFPPAGALHTPTELQGWLAQKRLSLDTFTLPTNLQKQLALQVSSVPLPVQVCSYQEHPYRLSDRTVTLGVYQITTFTPQKGGLHTESQADLWMTEKTRQLFDPEWHFGSCEQFSIEANHKGLQP